MFTSVLDSYTYITLQPYAKGSTLPSFKPPIVSTCIVIHGLDDIISTLATGSISSILLKRTVEG